MIVQSEIADKKQAILNSTLKLIKEHGLHGTTVSMISKKAGVASGTIYHYFPGKDDIIMELNCQVRKEMLDAMFGEASSKKEYRQQFFEGWINLCKYFISNPGSLIFIEQFNSSPYAKINSAKKLKGSVNRFHEFLQQGMDEGYLKKMEYKLIASAVFGCITATAKYHITGRFGFKDNDLCKVATILWDGIKIQ
ncbi:MAG: TetR/AcrR family transcriptional regulator [Bacteroidota bacterium]|nr:TetR/AcrR family transcriptional regulator [Bacteroidota bacterium]